MPQLTRVIVAYGDKVAMEADLTSALAAVFGDGGATTGGADGGATPPDTGDDAVLAQELYNKAIEAQKAGDWAAYGTYVEQLGAVLDRLAGVPSEAATATP